MWLNLSTIFRRLSHDSNIRSVILTGAGDRAFTAGLDVKAASEGSITRTSTDPARTANVRHSLKYLPSTFKTDRPSVLDARCPNLS
jgi:delta(3,5)-delta(2,4)-dienoyl-CoA isomerase